eukprot:g1399.t1
MVEQLPSWEGYLNKIKRGEGGRKRRYFCTDDRYLKYFKTSKDREQQRIRGMYDLMFLNEKQGRISLSTSGLNIKLAFQDDSVKVLGGLKASEMKRLAIVLETRYEHFKQRKQIKNDLQIAENIAMSEARDAEEEWSRNIEMRARAIECTFREVRKMETNFHTYLRQKEGIEKTYKIRKSLIEHDGDAYLRTLESDSTAMLIVLKSEQASLLRNKSRPAAGKLSEIADEIRTERAIWKEMSLTHEHYETIREGELIASENAAIAVKEELEAVTRDLRAKLRASKGELSYSRGKNQRLNAAISKENAELTALRRNLVEAQESRTAASLELESDFESRMASVAREREFSIQSMGIKQRTEIVKLQELLETETRAAKALVEDRDALIQIHRPGCWKRRQHQAGCNARPNVLSARIASDLKASLAIIDRELSETIRNDNARVERLYSDALAEIDRYSRKIGD